jgi:nucleotide-binding universal stress UspA family protein
MNARGAMEIIVATIGLSLGVLSQSMYSIVVMVAIVTSLMAPPLLRWTLSKVAMGAEEAHRLQQEEQASRSFIKNVHRVLIPTSGGANVQLAAQLINDLAHQNTLDITALYASPQPLPGAASPLGKDTASAQALRAVSQAITSSETGRSKAFLKTKVELGSNSAEVILKEARRGYDLIVLGATEQKGLAGALFNPLVDLVVRESPCATLVVKSHLPIAGGEFCPIEPQPINHILVPTIGSDYSKSAMEVASTIAAATGALLTLVHVANLPSHEYILYEQRTLDPVMDIASQILQYQVDIARSLGARVEYQILEGDSPEQLILDFAQMEKVDLIVLGSIIRMITGRVFFGHRVDAILNRATCPVAVLSLGNSR